MSNRRLMRLLLLCNIILMVGDVRPQQPFDLDTTFRSQIDTWYVSSILPQADGKVIISGQMKFPGDLSFRSGARLNPDGTKDATFPDIAYMGGKLTSWNDRVYQRNGHIVRRSWPDGMLDTDFIMMNNDPLFSSLQGGDYHVYSDGRILMSGVHILHDTLRGYLGPHCLIWFSNTGYLDTTQHHRMCWGSLDVFTELPNGQFIGSGSTSTWDEQPASNIIRFNTDGELDTSFQANVWWGQAYGFLPLQDGRVYAGGNFRITGDPDTLHLVRFMPDGSLDLTFNNHLDFRSIDLSGSVGAVVGRVFHQLDPGRLIITGAFELVDGQPRQGICLIDTAGNLLDDYFNGPGCGDYTYQGFTYGGIEGIIHAPDGSYYVWGAYHGYDDDTTNDTLQRMVSRLYGLDVGVEESVEPTVTVQLFPNPATDHAEVRWPTDMNATSLEIVDVTGRMVLVRSLQPQTSQLALEVEALPSGLYFLHLTDGKRWLAGSKVVVE